MRLISRVPWCRGNRKSAPEGAAKVAVRYWGGQARVLGETFTRPRKAATLKGMFKEALKGVVEATEGGLAGLLMDFEGIPLEVYAKDGTPFDIEAVGAEISVVVKAIQR